MRPSIARSRFVIMRRRHSILWLVLAAYLVATLVGRELHSLTCVSHLGVHSAAHDASAHSAVAGCASRHANDASENSVGGRVPDATRNAHELKSACESHASHGVRCKSQRSKAGRAAGVAASALRGDARANRGSGDDAAEVEGHRDASWFSGLEAESHHDCGDCTICQTLAQAQFARHDRVGVLFVEQVRAAGYATLPCRPVLHRSPFQSRGPPSDLFAWASC